MQKIFQHIRKQPKHVRENYAFGVAASFTTIVLLVWIVSRPQEGFLGDISSQVSETAAPFATLVKESKEQLAQLRGAVASSTEQATSTPEAAPAADTLVLTPEDITIANTASTTASTTTEPKAYVEVMIGTSSQALPSIQNTATSDPEAAQ